MNGADRVVDRVAPVVHVADAGGDRGEGADDRHEPGEHDRDRAQALEELVRAHHVLAAEQAALLALEDARTRPCGRSDSPTSPPRKAATAMLRQTIQIGIWMPVGSSIIVPVKVSTPVMISSVSPGRMNPTSSPVSAKTMRQTTEQSPRADASMRLPGSRHGMSPVAAAGSDASTWKSPDVGRWQRSAGVLASA